MTAIAAASAWYTDGGSISTPRARTCAAKTCWSLPFAVRFHLHPDVQASLVQGGAAVLLKLGGGQGWRFRCAGGQVSVDESIYLGERGHMRRSQQIVVTGEAGADGASIRWALKKV